MACFWMRKTGKLEGQVGSRLTRIKLVAPQAPSQLRQAPDLRRWPREGRRPLRVSIGLFLAHNTSKKQEIARKYMKIP